MILSHSESDDLAQIAYEAFRMSFGWTGAKGQTIAATPRVGDWRSLCDVEREAWRAATVALIEEWEKND